MQTDDISRHLHDRATRGEDLTTDEEAQLVAWYAEQDRLEADGLVIPDEAPSLSVLKLQVDEAISQLRSTARQIEDVAAENDAIRQEIAVLQDRLARLVNTQPA